MFGDYMRRCLGALVPLLLALHSAALAAERATGQGGLPDAPPSPAEVERLLGGPGTPDGAAAAPVPPVVFGKSIVVPFLFEGGHILIEAVLDGGPAKSFFFDSGGRNSVTPDVAREFAFHFNGESESLSGIGSHRPEARIATVGRIAIGLAAMESQKVFVVELPNSLVDRGARPRVAGLIGSELLRSYVVRIDYRNRQLTLTPIGQFQPPTDGFSLPLSLGISKDGLFQGSLQATIDHVAGQFIVDTGSGGQILLTPGFEQEHKIVDRYAKVVTIMTPGGIGGRQQMRMGLGDSFMVGAATFSKPLVDTSDTPALTHYIPETPSLREQRKPVIVADTTQAGLIGNGVLAHFIVTLDYKGGRIYFEAPTAMQLTPLVAGTGLFIDKPKHDYFEVIDVLPGTAAERAGLRRGDRIVEVNGDPARDLSLGDVAIFDHMLARKAMSVKTEDGRRSTLAIAQILP